MCPPAWSGRTAPDLEATMHRIRSMYPDSNTNSSGPFRWPWDSWWERPGHGHMNRMKEAQHTKRDRILRGYARVRCLLFWELQRPATSGPWMGGVCCSIFHGRGSPYRSRPWWTAGILLSTGNAGSWWQCNRLIARLYQLSYSSIHHGAVAAEWIMLCVNDGGERNKSNVGVQSKR